MANDKVNFTFLLGGKSVCGQENKPDNCLDCDKLTNCVMDMFHESVGKNEPDFLDLIQSYCEAHAKYTRNDGKALAMLSVATLIDNLKRNPSEVIYRANLEGWYPE